MMWVAEGGGPSGMCGRVESILREHEGSTTAQRLKNGWGQKIAESEMNRLVREAKEM